MPLGSEKRGDRRIHRPAQGPLESLGVVVGRHGLARLPGTPGNPGRASAPARRRPASRGKVRTEGRGPLGYVCAVRSTSAARRPALLTPPNLRVLAGRLLPCRLVIGHPRRSLTSPPEQPGRGRFPRAIRGRRAGLVAAGFALVCLLLTACSGGPQNGLAPSGIYARRADNLFGKVFIIVVVVFVLVEGAIVYFLIKYRERPGRNDPVQIHGHTRAEAIWTIIPA
ncbi:MAG: hypothetical protein E6G66_06370, partial [Actinobacteria bacterium]